MTRLQQVLFELDAPYMGHAYFVPGHALYNALARRVDDATRQALHVSHGVFLPGEWGEYPATHPDEGSLGKLAGSLPDVESYADWFLLRNPTHPWLLDSRPRDAHNTQDLQAFGGRVAAASETRFARPSETRNRQRSVQWYVHCYVSVDGVDDTIPVPEDVLGGIQVGGARNYGFGELSVADTNVVALDDVAFDRLQAAAHGEEPCRVELVTPYVTESKFPGAEPQSVPWWWNVSAFDAAPGNYAKATGMRSRVTRLAQGGEAYSVRVLDHGQRVGFAGDAERVVETARNGITRIGTHSRFGFGELRVRPPQAVPQYARRDDESRAAREAEPVASDTATQSGEAAEEADAEDDDEDRDADEPRRRVLVGAAGDAATQSGGDGS